MLLNSVSTMAKSNKRYFGAQTAAHLCWIMNQNIFHTKCWKSFICSPKVASLSWVWCKNLTRQLKIFVYSPSTYKQSVLNINSKHDSLQLHWHPSCKEIFSKYDVLQVMFVYLISTFILIVIKRTPNMTCSNTRKTFVALDMRWMRVEILTRRMW